MEVLADGSRPAPDDDEARWAAAQSVLDEAPTPLAEDRLRRHKLLTWLFVGGLVLVTAAVGVLVASLLVGGDPESDPALWREVSGMVISAIGLVVLIGGGVIALRAGIWRGIWSQPATVLSRAQRRLLLAQVRGRAPADPARLPLARYLAERMRLQRHLLLVWVGLCLQQVGRAVSSTSTVDLVLVAAALAAYLIGLLLLARDARRAQRFLQTHPDQRAEGAAAA